MLKKDWLLQKDFVLCVRLPNSHRLHHNIITYFKYNSKCKSFNHMVTIEACEESSIEDQVPDELN